ncbi:hypothetical protein ANANG_G00101290 [Anguilla anguilla]|uniref:Uncharacterized protein n=1 Tax=Anguilla anguilla TaxID=7936 RepID=A0A9D3MGR9_ANGAN|nr:hypothetical protein ANANG_G00101290 [Anguilla anguilla]
MLQPKDRTATRGGKTVSIFSLSISQCFPCNSYRFSFQSFCLLFFADVLSFSG